MEAGAVRHGAECFNFYFPQELDREYLVIYEGFGKARLCQAVLISSLQRKIPHRTY